LTGSKSNTSDRYGLIQSAIALRDEVGFFQAIRAAMVKHTTFGGKSLEDIDAVVR